jgi:hypothetical protein
MLYLNGLPRLHHPVFNVPNFVRASQDRFFLCIEATDPLFDRENTALFLRSLGAHGLIFEVPHEIVGEPAQLEKIGMDATAKESAAVGQP